ncbi:MAG: TatA/E family twin arginine-targeting protein translocase [Prochlorococcus sp.]|jgi:sec-independent protein translocase protein TatA|nr:TatA/E family twin arginine-targeting protein translocase [Prochlorococcaceae cyanobacterium ETNP18_MAG_17]HJO77761.1 TatA/E family twin arginine-targeting protein translocase [Prochlorococcaceae cyanobacterium Fu_MAG_134]
MNVFGIGLPEMAVIGAIALLVFGPKRLPEFGRTLGKTLKGFQAASKEFEREIHKTMAEPESLEGEDLDSPSQSSPQLSSESSQEVHTPPAS